MVTEFVVVWSRLAFRHVLCQIRDVMNMSDSQF
jgi:hypothetical protein